MKLQYVSSACVLIEHQGVKVLCDPWLTDGIYGGAWYHNPPLKVTPEDFADIDYIYISHIHPDHFDEATLVRLPKVPVLIGNYAEPFLAKKLTAMGFPVYVCLSPGRYSLGKSGDFWLEIIPADDCNPQACGKWIGCEIKNPKRGESYQIDTLAVFRGGGKAIVNVNDCPYELAYRALWHVTPKPDLLCVGYAGAGPYPQCFSNLSLEEKRAAAAQKQAQFLNQMQAFVSHLQPKRYLPFAGQYTLGGSLVDLNDLGGVPELEDLPDDDRMVRLNRMAWFDCETGQASEAFTPTPKAERLAYRESLRSKRLDHENDPWPDNSEMADLFDEAIKQWRRRCADRGIDTSQMSAQVRAVFADGTGYGRNLGTSEWAEISADARLWKRILTRQFNLNNAEVGSLLTFDRPGQFNRALQNSLSYLHV